MMAGEASGNAHQDAAEQHRDAADRHDLAAVEDLKHG